MSTTDAKGLFPRQSSSAAPMLNALNPLANQPAGFLELEAAADDYDVRAEAVDQLGQRGDGWRLRAARLRVLAQRLKTPSIVVTMTSAGTEDPPDLSFSETTDARKWGRAFLDRLAMNPDLASDEGTMIGWFANAIERGRSAGLSASKDKVEAFNRIAEAYLQIPAGTPTPNEIATAKNNLIEVVGREVQRLHPSYSGARDG